jgi:hypothetical protein
MQAVTNNNYEIDHLKELVAKSHNVRIPKNYNGSSAQLAQVIASAKQAFAGVEGFDVDTYVNVLLSRIIGEQKVPVITKDGKPFCERNADIKGGFKATKGGSGTVSTHAGDMIKVGGSAAKDGNATVTVSRNGSVVYQETFKGVDARTQADTKANEFKDKNPNAKYCK